MLLITNLIFFIMKKIALLAIVACLSLFVVSCKEEKKAEAAPAEKAAREAVEKVGEVLKKPPRRSVMPSRTPAKPSRMLPTPLRTPLRKQLRRSRSNPYRFLQKKSD